MNISRCEGARVMGWQVRVERKKLTVYRCFSDSRYGGKRRALRAAERFLRTLTLPPIQYGMGQIGVTAKTRARSSGKRLPA